MSERLIVHPFTFAVFPIVALLSYNITEITSRVALRATVISLILTLLLVLLITLLTRSLQKAALSTTLFLILFFSYGHVYEFLRNNLLFGFSLGRHRYLVVVFGLLLLAGLFWIYRILKDTKISTQTLNVVGILLLIYPAFRIINYSIHTDISEQKITASPASNVMLVPENPKRLPDIYLIVLDSYTRADALLSDYGFDNSPFLDGLRSMGFYVAECSRANASYTHGSLATMLNMESLLTLNARLADQGLTHQDIWMLIKHSQVRTLLESIGYQTVAFDSGFEWTRLSDADVYLKYSGLPYEKQVAQPFEVMLIHTTALLIWSDFTYQPTTGYNPTPWADINFEFDDHINRARYTLNELPKLASYPGPKFVFAHILVPHYPFVFKPNGDILTDPKFFDYNVSQPSDASVRAEGYTNEIQFDNNRMLEILPTLIKKSSIPPIIILMGDHGLESDNHWVNLNTYYLPKDGEQNLYPTITPVNSFRVIFDTYFGTHYGLIEDISYKDDGTIVPEIYPDCLP